MGKEEAGNIWKKDANPMNYDRHYDREKNWNEEDQEEPVKEIQSLEDIMKDKDKNSINVDR